MDSIGYLVTPKFMLIGVDTNLVIRVFDDDQDPLATLHLTDIEKVRLLSPTAAVVAVGLTQKVGDVYNYLDGLAHTPHGLEEVLADLHWLFDGNDTGLAQQVAAETLLMRQQGHATATQVFVFAHERGQNRVAHYQLLGPHLTNQRPDDFPPEPFAFGLWSSMHDPAAITQMQQGYQRSLHAATLPGWDHDPERVAALKQQARTYIRQGLGAIHSFRRFPPTIVFYELSPDTGHVFQEPSHELRTLTTRRL